MPLLSIIIPTHERTDYVIETIKSLALIAEKSLFEIVVCDSSRVDGVSVHFQDEIKSGFVKYFHCPFNDNVVKNFEYGYSKAAGEYLLSIGDDDVVSKFIFKIIDKMVSDSIDILNVRFTSEYFWPDFSHNRLGTSLNDSLKRKSFTGRWYKVNALKEKKKACERIGHGLFNMPRAYLGIISKSLYSTVIENKGHLFGGVSPDIYSSSLLSDYAKNAMMLDMPIIIPGASKKSTSGKSVTGEHTGDLKDNDHISAFGDIEWDDFIPEFYSVPSVWGYSLLVSLDNRKRVNFLTLYIHCFLRHPEFRCHTLKSFQKFYSNASIVRLPFMAIKAMYNEFCWFVDVISNRFRSGGGAVTGSVGGINEARKLVDRDILRFFDES